MADNENLQTASLYINNQLLSRGLLQDGQSIDFAKPIGNDGGAEEAMGKVMSIVNDLILRRDRDAENRENLSTTLRNLRAENLRNTSDMSRLTEKHAEAQRKLNMAESSESSLRTQLKSADAAVRGLKEEMVRAKSLVAQTRASCATDVRRRDRQIDGLKKQLGDAGRARGGARNPAVTVVNVVADVGGEAAVQSGSTADPSYDLRSETNEFLTRLAKDLSEENETLLALARRTLAKLKEMSEWDKDRGANNNLGGGGSGDGHATTLQTNCAEMEAEMDAVLNNLRTILTNPSFVPIEEVELRDEEINRLKDGWVKMESRWQEAVHLIDGWRRRMASDGKGVNMEELNMGLRLSPIRDRDVAGTNYAPTEFRLSRVDEEGEEEDAAAIGSPCPAPKPEGSLHLTPAREYEVEAAEDDRSDYESSIFEDDLDVEELEAPEPNVEVLQQSAAYLSSPPLPPPPQLSPLKASASAGNRGDAPATKRNKPGGCATIVEENTWDLADDAEPTNRPPSHRINLPRSPQKAARPSSPELEEQNQTEPPTAAAADSSLDDVLLVQDPEEPPSPSPLPKERPPPSAQPPEGPPKPYLRRKEAERPAPPAQKKATTTATTANNTERQQPSKTQPSDATSNRTRTRTRDVSSESVEDNLPPLPAMPPSASATPNPNPTRNRSPDRITSRLPLPRPANISQQPQQSPLTMATIAAKLAASEREADAARVRAKLRAFRGGTGAVAGAGAGKRRLGTVPGNVADAMATPSVVGEAAKRDTREAAIPEDAEAIEEGIKENVDVDPVKRSIPEPGQDGQTGREARTEDDDENAARQREQQENKHEGEREQQEAQQLPLPKRKRDKRASKVASRRRSTLSPWEMESLISGSVPVSPPAK